MTPVQGRLTCRQFPGAGSGFPPYGCRWPEKREPGSRHRAAAACPTERLVDRRETQHSLAEAASRGGSRKAPPRSGQQTRSVLLLPVVSPPRGLPSLSSALITNARWAVLTCQHAGEEHGWEVMVEVEDPAHQEEREVMEHPAEQQLPASSQQDLGQPWAKEHSPSQQMGQGTEPGRESSSAPSLLWALKKPHRLTGPSFPPLDQVEQPSGSWQTGAAGSQEPCSPRRPERPQHPWKAHQTPAGGSTTSKASKILHTLQGAAPLPPSPTSLLPHRPWPL